MKSLAWIRERVKINPETNCWEWQKSKLKAGYGTTWEGTENDRIRILVHRLTWIIVHGEIPGKMCVCHHCDNPPCCNPDHLFLGTYKDNCNDMIQKGRRKIGVISDEGRAKIGASSSKRVSGDKNYFHNNPRPQHEIEARVRKMKLASKSYFWQESSQRWRVNWSCDDGKRRSWLVKTEQEAIAKVAELKQELMESING